MDMRARRRLFGLGLAATISLGSLAVRPTGALLAQDVADASLAGRATGPDGAPIAGAAVTVTSAELDAGDVSLTTDGAGRFSLESLRPGFYDVAVEVAGYRRGSVGAVRVESGQTARVEIVLERLADGEGGY